MIQHIEAAKLGDELAFEHIVRHYTGMGITIAYEKLRDNQLAEDAVQEAFTEAFLHLDKLRTADAFPGWFKVIVVRQCYRILRRQQHDKVPYDEAVHSVESPTNVAELIEQREMQQLIHDSIAKLTSNMRIAVQLFYFQGYSLKEISLVLGVSVPVLKKRIFDARHKLKGALPVADLISVFHHLHEGGQRMLHIVNGDSVAERLREGVVDGDILVWREVYPHGPVFVDPAISNHRTVRAQYLEQTLGVPKGDFIQSSEDQEKVLADFQKYDEVVLWFEHDLFDQSMLCYLLHWFSQQHLGTMKLSLLCIGEYPGIEVFRGLGQLSAEQLGTLSGTWRTIGAPELELGKALWQAYASQDPMRLQQMLTEDTSALPFAHDAFEAHLSRFPSTYNGLGVVEQTTLEMVHAGINTPHELFRNVGNKLHVLGMGDLEYWYLLQKMSQDPCPLLQMDDLTVRPTFNEPTTPVHNAEVALTELGMAVMNGQEDWVVTKGIDQWYGGVHLLGKSPQWRWDSANKTLQ
ncbi:sigma-70 family RNA polymerase sigma factor [Paenibacillus segetis]|uniref:RNA polymerase subunit sigma n=1 Tax=Paenibacillus segetis TaxID=1325360 RepID=A0ABQ1YN60_9BACL|nr:sigma-70 family RNA polymerase sigma factor [Paenibacillus segetis]GGH30842.1 hypothetical protein GCM10008013_34190 [Paenibacillus segetis]